MLRGDASGRVPFSLVAILLLLSGGLSAMYAAKLGREEAKARANEARLAALAQVADDVHREVSAQAQYVGLDAIAKGTLGILNETRVAEAFRTGFADFVASHFPRVVRAVAVRVSDYEATIGLVQRRVEDLQPSNATRVESVDGQAIATPDPAAPEALAPADRLAYFEVHGFMNYTLARDDVTLTKFAALTTLVPIPAPLMEAKLEQAARAGEGDLAGVGRTVKAILASLAQFRVLNGVASPMRRGTTTRDVLTPNDVELAVNLALLLEEARLFRTYDRGAAAAIDAAHVPPTVPLGLPPPTADRTLVRLLDRYAADGTLDATDLFALYTGLDAQGLSLGPIFAQAMAAIADELVLKPLEYFGLMPLADWVQNVTAQTVNAVDDFLRWLTGQASRQATYVYQYVETVLVDSGVGTRFLGPLDFGLPARAYDVPGGSGAIHISVAAHDVTVPFSAKELTLGDHDKFWSCFYPQLNASVDAIGGTLRDLANDVSARIANVAVWSGLLPTSATGALDPKDGASFLDILGARVGKAVDDALAWFRSNPYAVDALMANLWDQTKSMLQHLVDYMMAGYDAAGCAPALVDASAETLRAYHAIADDLFARASAGMALNASQLNALRSSVNADVTQHGWDALAFAGRKATDIANWQRALMLADGSTQPGSHLRAQLREEVGGATGWLALAAGSVKGLMAEAVGAQDVAALRAVYTMTSRPFVLWDPWQNTAALTEQFRVRHSPGYLRRTPGPPEASPPREGELRIAMDDPADLTPTEDTPNVHYTKPLELSRRPFTAEWTVRVSGAVHLRVETALPVLVGAHGLEPAVLEKAWPLNFSISFAAYSGWNLTAVQYRPSDTLFADILSFLDQGLLDTVRIVRMVLDVYRKVFESVWKLMEQLTDFAYKIVRVLGELVSHLLDILRMMATQVLAVVGRVVDAIRSAFGSEARFTLNLAGLPTDVLVNGASGRSLALDVHYLGHARLAFVRLGESEWRALAPPAATYDVLGAWNGAVGPLHQVATFDPLNVSQPKMIEGDASWDGAWRANYSGPDVESAYLIDRPIAIEVPLEEVGLDVDIEFGAEALLLGRPVFDAEEALARSVEEGLAEVQPIRSWRDAGRVVRAIERRIEVNVLDVIEAAIVEASVYVQVDVKAAAAAGVGLRLSLVADGAAIRLVLEWIIDNVAAYFEAGLNPLAPAQYAALSRGALEHTSVRVEGHFIAGAPSFLKDLGVEGEIRMASRLEPNLAAIGRLLGASGGSPKVEFGLLVDGRFQLSWLPGAYVVVYILRGAAVPQ